MSSAEPSGLEERPGRPKRRLVLASASPRRRELLGKLGLSDPIIRPADLDESPHPRELAGPYAERLAREKAEAVFRAGDFDKPAFILAADTAVAVGRRILPKTETREEALMCLELLSGRRHRVYTGIALVQPSGITVSRLVMTRVGMKRLSREEIAYYLSSEEWRGKAGGYGIQGLAEAFIPSINGSFSNVVGLPLAETAALLIGAGFSLFQGDPPPDQTI